MNPDRRPLLPAVLSTTALAAVFLAIPALAAPAAGSGPPGLDDVPCWEREPPCGGSPAAPDTTDPDATVPAADITDAADTAGENPGPIVISRASGRGGPDRAEMAAWHRRYLPALAPVKAALGRVVAAAPTARPPHLVPFCRRLGEALTGVDRRVLLPAPDLATDLYLKRVLARLGDAAAACAEGAFARTDLHLLEAGHAVGQLDLALRHYGLSW